MSFVVSNQGKVYEKDLGPDSVKVAAGIRAFDPDSSWREVDEATLRAAAATSPEDAVFAERGSEVPVVAPPASELEGPATSEPTDDSSLPTAPVPTPAPCPQRR